MARPPVYVGLWAGGRQITAIPAATYSDAAYAVSLLGFADDPDLRTLSRLVLSHRSGDRRWQSGEYTLVFTEDYHADLK
jgi:hypothetical protein